ncbi:unnamed protein product [Prorocentrum cordatum]|uniref:HEAT repeat-containing protein 1 n=1 Tax=Prorocentrum cordatum TaxID=2364126 RepID=A0ABN9UJL3_9DINO|nr:unnamed protein product [Polarella glacialis]
MALHRGRRAGGMFQIVLSAAVCSHGALFLCSFASAGRSARRQQESTRDPVRGQGAWPRCVLRKRRYARDVRCLYMSPSSLMKNIQAAQTCDELFSLSGQEDTDMLHRASILLQLSRLNFKTSSRVGQMSAWRNLLFKVMGDIPGWKSSSSFKNRQISRNAWTERGHYLGNVVYSLGRLDGVVSAGLSEGEHALLREHTTLAVLEALPDLIKNNQTDALAEIVFGLRKTERNLQTDEIFRTLAPHIPDLLRAGRSRDLNLGNIVVAYSLYALPDPVIVDMFVELKGMVSELSTSNPSFGITCSRICTAYVRYEAFCARAVDNVNTYSVFLVKRDPNDGLGIAMRPRNSQRAIEVVKIARGLVSRWNRLYPAWMVQEEDEIIKANAVAGDVKSVVEEIRSSSEVMLTIRRKRVTLRKLADPEAMKDKVMITSLAMKFVESCRRYADGPPMLSIIGLLTGTVLFDADVEPFYTYVAPHLKAMIPRETFKNAAHILWLLSLKNVFHDKSIVKGLANRVVVPLRSIAIADKHKSYIPCIVNALKMLRFESSSEVMQELKSAAQQVGITDQELDRPQNPVHLFLTVED